MCAGGAFQCSMTNLTRPTAMPPSVPIGPLDSAWKANWRTALMLRETGDYLGIRVHEFLRTGLRSERTPNLANQTRLQRMFTIRMRLAQILLDHAWTNPSLWNQRGAWSDNALKVRVSLRLWPTADGSALRERFYRRALRWVDPALTHPRAPIEIPGEQKTVVLFDSYHRRNDNPHLHAILLNRSGMPSEHFRQTFRLKARKLPMVSDVYCEPIDSPRWSGSLRLVFAYAQRRRRLRNRSSDPVKLYSDA